MSRLYETIMSSVRETKVLLLERAHQLSGEYWWHNGTVTYADGDNSDTSHSIVVFERLISDYCDVIGIENTFECDIVMFRSSISDDGYGLDEDDPIEDLTNRVIKQTGINQKEADTRRGIVFSGDGMDPREFAIKFWGWIRIAGNNLELPDLKPATLKKAASAFVMALDDSGYGIGEDEDLIDTEVNVSTYNGSRKTVSLSDLMDGRLSSGVDADTEALRDAGSRAVANLDAEITHPFYK